MPDRRWRRRRGALERTLAHLLKALEKAQRADIRSTQGGLLQGLDPRVKLTGILLLIVAVASAASLPPILGIVLAAIALGIASRVSWPEFFGAWISAFVFTFLVGFPAVFLTPGPELSRLPLLGWPVSASGLQSWMYLLARAEATVTLSLLLVLTTPWTHLLKALRSLHVPVVLVVLIGMTYRYIFVLLETARDMFEAHRSRVVGPLERADARRLILASTGVLLTKTFQLSNDVYLAMQSRGFRGEVQVLDDFAMTARDWIALAGFSALALLVFAGPL